MIDDCDKNIPTSLKEKALESNLEMEHQPLA